MCLALAWEHYVYTGLGSGFYFVGVSGPSPSIESSDQQISYFDFLYQNTHAKLRRHASQVHFAKNTLTYINTCVFGKT